jgi:hypothetical protein
MSRTSWRIGVATGVVLLALAGGVEVAWACNEPHIKASPSMVGPRDTVTWTIGNVEPRATYTVSLAGRPLAQGEAGASAPTGTFQMPHLGSTPRDVYVELSVSHTEPSETHPNGPLSNPTGNPWKLSYRVPPAPQVTQESPPTSTPVTPPPADGLGDAAPKKRGSPRNRATEGPRDPGPPTRSPGGREPAPRSPASTPSPLPVGDTQIPNTATAPSGAEPRAMGRSTVNARSRSTVNGTDGSAVATTDRSAAAAGDRSAVKSKSQPTEAIDPRTRPREQPSRSVPRVQPPRKTIRPLEDGDAIPGIILVGLSALLVLGVGAVAIWVLYPRGSTPGSRLAEGGPQWIPPGLGLEARGRDLLIEAELQEMIAEERARRLPRETAADRTG